MKKFGKQVRYNEDGLRVGRNVSHQDRLNEKHLRAALHRKSFDIADEDDIEDEFVPLPYEDRTDKSW